MIHRAVVVALLLILSGSTSALGRAPLVLPAAGELQSIVEALTAPGMDGRRSGTPGGDLAARRLAAAMGAAGLQPGGDHGTFLQSFVLAPGTRVGPESALEILTPGPRAFVPGVEWTPHGGSSHEDVTAPLAFAGYGVVAPEAAYDDYAAIDVRGRIALVLDGAPAFVARKMSRLDKLIVARRRGARALLIVSGALPSAGASGAPFGLVSAAVTAAVADALMAATGTTVAERAATIAGTRAPASAVLPVQARVRAHLVPDDRRAVNVIGLLPGADPTLAQEAIVLGAHYDHVGVIGGAVHPGADDNASGTAVVLGLARAYAAAGGAGRTLVFALFGAEELGLIGSGHYVKHPSMPLGRTVAMLNFDMVGRMRDGQLHVGGVDSGSGLRDAVTESARAAGVTLTMRGSPYSPSDHTRFYTAGTPVLFFFTGTHPDYHAPGDTADRINTAGMARAAAVAAGVVARLERGTPPMYVRLPVPPPRTSRRSGAPVFFGIGADGRSTWDALRLSQVVPGSAAERAGLRDGDVIVRFDDAAVGSLEELRTVLGTKRPGDTVEVVYLRDGRETTTSATLERSTTE
ncbi:MAG: M28 family peptidase [Candidatus Rokuibacteriota bacterium]